MMNPSHIPPGLEYLGMIDQIIIKQKVQLLEVFTGFESANKYAIKNSMGQDIFFAVEDTDCCTRNCCGPIRPFGIKVLDNFKREVMYIERPLRCDTCWFPCCLQTLEVMAPPGTTLGYVVQEWSILYPRFRIENAMHETVLRIEGPACRWSCCGSDVVFHVSFPTLVAVRPRFLRALRSLVVFIRSLTPLAASTVRCHITVKWKAVT